jgi:hypothetical protein
MSAIHAETTHAARRNQITSMVNILEGTVSLQLSGREETSDKQLLNFDYLFLYEKEFSQWTSLTTAATVPLQKYGTACWLDGLGPSGWASCCSC